MISCEGFSGATFARPEERRAGGARLAEMFPSANLIIGFRPHRGFVASLYSQDITGAAPRSTASFSLEGPQDGVIWRREDLCVRAIVDSIEGSFGKPPFVFQMSGLRRNKKGLLSDLAAVLGASQVPVLSRG